MGLGSADPLPLNLGNVHLPTVILHTIFEAQISNFASDAFVQLESRKESGIDQCDAKTRYLQGYRDKAEIVLSVR
jgi:hypothetical protein